MQVRHLWCLPKVDLGIAELLEKIVEVIPPPMGDADKDTQGLIFDSWFDPYRGVIILVRMMHGRIKK